MVERTIQAVIADVRDDTECRKRYGDVPYDDEIMLAEIDALRSLIRLFAAGDETLGNTAQYADVFRRAVEAGNG